MNVTATEASRGPATSDVPPPSPTLPAYDTPSALGAPRDSWIDRRSLRHWPRAERLGFGALLLATLGFYLYGLSANGYANSFYSAAAQAGSVDWTAFFFGSSDAGNSITVDKPPAALWVMALSLRLFGLNSWAILVPEVLMGVATVGLLYRSVRRYVGHGGAMLAGAALALTPVAVLMFRFNNPDALLTLLLVAAAWATLRAIEPEEQTPYGGARRRFAMTSVRWFAVVGLFVGLAFLTKTLQAFLLVPVLGLVYLIAAPGSIGRRALGALAGVSTMVLAGGWWVAIVELLPANMRPYVGGSQTNSFLELTFGYNGLGRIDGNETGSVGGGPVGAAGGAGGGGSMWGQTGLFRMFLGISGGHVSWLLPTALIFLVAGLWATARTRRTDPLRAAFLVWGGWTIVTTLVFSFMAGIYHDYYTVALAPGIAGLVGLGAGLGWRRRDVRLWTAVLALGTAAAAIWAFVLLTRVATVAYGPLRYVVLIAGLAAALLLLVHHRIHRRVVPIVAATAIAASLAGPAAYSASTVTSAHQGSIVTAGPAGVGQGGPGGFGGRGQFGGGFPPGAPGAQPGAGMQPGAGTQSGGGTQPQFPGGMPGGMGGTGVTGRTGGASGLLNAATPSTAVVQALQANAGSYRWVAATIGSQNAAGLQLGTGEPVMPIGGFNGSDPSPTLAQFQSYVTSGQIHYFLAGGGMGGRQNGGSNAAAQISAWVQANYTSVNIGGQTFYDLTQPLADAS
ncbi:MAG: glycosyltransferase family 39 protein [Austwickia sp.]|jgi:4-amino-4-deoxy-L-arabinose transferase-like glycosyltransferase|nr:MAG: glycosyltransferase family 39 protein [Austwickia sp.]